MLWINFIKKQLLLWTKTAYNKGKENVKYWLFIDLKNKLFRYLYDW